ncbi:MAG: diguanylate cyclase [Chloroflexi bacterium]|nr:diguanylate cyclase [Chloroflexota bacterium]
MPERRVRSSRAAALAAFLPGALAAIGVAYAATVIFPNDAGQAGVVAGLFVVGAAAAALSRKLAARQVVEVVREDLVDADSGLGNDRHLAEVLGREIARSLRHGGCAALAVFAIHPAGFRPLEPGERPPPFGRHLAKTLLKVARRSDAIARIDEHHFAVVLTECDEEGADALLGRVRTALTTGPYARNHDGSGIYARSWGAAVAWEPKFTTPEPYLHAALAQLAAARMEASAQQQWSGAGASGTPREKPIHGPAA